MDMVKQLEEIVNNEKENYFYDTIDSEVDDADENVFDKIFLGLLNTNRQ